MTVLKCPKCGKLSRSGLVPWPRCGQCLEQLLKCRYCAYFDARMFDCTCHFRPEDFHIHDPDMYLACPYHKSTLAVEAAPLVRKRVWLTPILLAAVAAVVVTFIARHFTTAPRAPVVQAAVIPVDEAFLREPVAVEIRIQNQGPGAVEHTVLALDRSYERHVVLQSVEPAPAQQRRSAKTHRMWFGSLAEGEVLELRLNVLPIRQGTWQLRADVMVPGTWRIEHIKSVLEIAQ